MFFQNSSYMGYCGALFPMLFSDAIFRCYFPMVFSDVIFRCYFPMLFSDAIFRCYFPMLFSDAIFRCYFPMLFSDLTEKITIFFCNRKSTGKFNRKFNGKYFNGKNNNFFCNRKSTGKFSGKFNGKNGILNGILSNVMESELFSIRMEKYQFLIQSFSLPVCHNTI